MSHRATPTTISATTTISNLLHPAGICGPPQRDQCADEAPTGVDAQSVASGLTSHSRDRRLDDLQAASGRFAVELFLLERGEHVYAVDDAAERGVLPIEIDRKSTRLKSST